MTTTRKSFAFRLFHAIRANKKALIAELPLYRPNSKNHEQNEALRGLIDAMFEFEKYCRGAQPALAEVRNDKCFTLNKKQKANGVHIYSCHLDFIIKASNMASHVLKLMVDCQNQLKGSTWELFLSLEGAFVSGYRDVIWEIIRKDRLPALVKATPGFSAKFPDTSVLKMEFKNGNAVKKVEEFFVIHIPEGKTVAEQIVQATKLCEDIMSFANKAVKDLTNWPTPADARSADVQDVHNILWQAYRGLPVQQQALLQKYPDEASHFFKNVA